MSENSQTDDISSIAKAAWDEAWKLAFSDGLSAGHPLGHSSLDCDTEWADSEVVARIAKLVAPAPSASPAALTVDMREHLQAGMMALKEFAPDNPWVANTRAMLTGQPASPTALPLAVLYALRFYASGQHFNLSDDTAWDTVSGEPVNFWCDEAGTATVEDGSIAKAVLQGKPIEFEEPEPAIQGEAFTVAEPARADRQALSDEDIQRRWDEACKDGPGRPGWSRHIRFARDIEHRAIAAFLENTRQYVTNDASRKAAIADAIAADRADRQGVALSEKTILEIAQPWFGEETKHLRLHLVEFALAVARAAYPSARASSSRAEVERDAEQLSQWLLTDPETGERLRFSGPLESDFLGLSRVKMESASGAVWTLTAGIKEGYLTASERMGNIRRAAADSPNQNKDA